MADVEAPRETSTASETGMAAEGVDVTPDDSKGHHPLEEVEMETKGGDAVLDFEAINPLLPDPPGDGDGDGAGQEGPDVSRKPSAVALGDMMTPGGLAAPIGQDLGETYYDDEDWKSDKEDEEEEEEEEGEGRKKRCRNVLVVLVLLVQMSVTSFLKHFNRLTGGHLLAIVLFLGYMAYFVRAMIYEVGSEASIRLIVCTVLGVLAWVSKYVYNFFTKALVKANGSTELSPKTRNALRKVRLVIRCLLYLALAAGMAYTIWQQAQKSMTNLRSLPGLAAFLIVCLFFSTAPANINWHTVYWGVGLQFLCALFVLEWDRGKDIVLWVQNRLEEFFANSEAGSVFLFGESYKDHFMIFGALPLLLFINATLVVLYYLGVMQFLIRVIGSFLSFVTDTTPIETASVASSIFLDGIVSALMLRPYLGSLSRSQLFVVITSIFSSLGGTYTSLLSSMGIPLSRTIPAMLISAPATIAVCKLMVPESDRMIRKQKKEGKDYDWKAEIKRQKSKYANVLDAAQDGAVSMLAVVAILMAVGFVFLSSVSWVNNTLDWFGNRIGVEDLTIERIFSYVLLPVSLAMGVEWEDCRRVAMLLGHRLASFNIIAFTKLLELKFNKAQYMQYMLTTNFTGPVTRDDQDVTLDMWGTTLKNGFLSDRSETIVTYSLCGYSSFIFGSMVLGIMYILLPKRRRWLSRTFVASLVAGNIANCMTGCFAGLFY